MADTVLTLYAPVLVLAVLAFVIVWATLGLTRFLSPRRLLPGKLSTYESGEVPQGPARGPIDVQYYLYVLVFLVVDVEAAFLIPVAMHYVKLTTFQFWAAVLFVVLLLDGWVYAWKKGAFTWQS